MNECAARSTDLSASASEALAAYRDATRCEGPVSETVWRAALSRAEAPRGWQLGVAFATACALGVMAAATAGALGERSEVTTAVVAPVGDAKVHREGARWVLERGKVRVAAGAEPQTIATAEVEVAVLNARVLVEAADGRTALFVEEGSVTWRDASGAHVAGAGTRLELESPASVGGPAGERAEPADGLAAQTALYEEGLRAHEAGRLEEAVGHFREYRRRFPAGVFAPEAGVALMLEARALGRLEEARSEAGEFLRVFGSDPRAKDVAAWRAQLP